MSGPVSTDDAPATPAAVSPGAGLEVLDGRTAEVGGVAVRRLLPRRARRTVGPWCFVDHLGPGPGLDIGPHPHTGLQTVTWLVEGRVLHRDSLGSEQLVRPGQLNLMTAGHGVAHSEETTGVHAGPLHGVQLWVAQPEATRHEPPAFEHHAGLPTVELPTAVATVVVGEVLGASSLARRDTEHVGVELALRAGAATVPLAAAFEHGLVVLKGDVGVGGRRLEPGRLGYLGPGRDEVVLDAPGPALVLLIGGRPFPEPLLMWWNYVARTREEVASSHRDWLAGGRRFGAVASPLDRIVVPGPPWAAPGD